ncbi:CZB domain-containing protein [Sulfurimonas sp.]
MRKAEHLVAGLPVSKEMIPLDATDYGFGRWLYDDGSRLRMISGMSEILDEIEGHHTDLHEMYTEIYTIFFVLPNKKSLLKKIFTFNSKEVTKADKEKAKTYFQSLKKSSEYLLNALNTLERKVNLLTLKDLEILHT